MSPPFIIPWRWSDASEEERAAALSALADNYRALAVLRSRREELEGLGRAGLSDAEGALRRDAFRRLAQAFPGCLRELDKRRAADLTRRADAVGVELTRLRAGQTPARTWVAIVVDFHHLLRHVLAVKLWLAHRVERDARRAPISDDLIAEFQAAHAIGDRDFIEHLLHPPHGRVLSLVWDALAVRHGRSRIALETAVFGEDPDPG